MVWAFELGDELVVGFGAGKRVGEAVLGFLRGIAGGNVVLQWSLLDALAEVG